MIVLYLGKLFDLMGVGLCKKLESECMRERQLRKLQGEGREKCWQQKGKCKRNKRKENNEKDEREGGKIRNRSIYGHLLLDLMILKQNH